MLADHSDTPDPRTDITDLFVFQKPRDVDHSVLILNINPQASIAAESYDVSASYELKIDTDGDLEADVAFHIMFEESLSGAPSATVFRSTGQSARGAGAIGEVVLREAPVSGGGSTPEATGTPYRLFAGLRSDPWFADVNGFLDDFRFTGQDTFVERNVFGIVLEVPNTALGSSTPAGIWARTVAPVHGEVTQIDQVGRPLINAIFNKSGAEQAAFNRTPPAQQLARFGDEFLDVIRSWGYGDEEARTHFADVLPDVLVYDRSAPAAYPNGRRLTDDILDIRVAMLTKGRVTSDLVGPHSDLLDEFPYLGEPHPVSKR